MQREAGIFLIRKIDQRFGSSELVILSRNGEHDGVFLAVEPNSSTNSPMLLELGELRDAIK